MTMAKWTVEQAKMWWRRTGAIRGFNYLPHTSVNSTEMWQAETFDPSTIRVELGWAQAGRLNSARVFLPYVVWKEDATAFKQRIDLFLTIADDCGISTMFILFDDCAFSGKQPYVGRQPDPVSGVHNSGWTPSPGFELALNPQRAAELEPYVKDLIGTFANDSRILCWDLYNEPGNSDLGESTLWLVQKAFAWAREVNPIQPLTTGAWKFPETQFSNAVNERLWNLSDVISFHYYGKPDEARFVKFLQAYGGDRPMLCTECLHRQSGNTLQALLPIFRQYQIGWYVWGLVEGRTQTYMHWGSVEGTLVPEIWQHDLLRFDGTPYDKSEWKLIGASI